MHHVSLRRLTNDLKAWYNAKRISHDLRIGELTMGMLGSKDSPDFGGKAAETGAVMIWALDFCQRHADRLREGCHLGAAGEPLVQYALLLKDSPLVVPHETCQALLDCVVQHCVRMQHADVRLLPKHHYWAHMTLQIPARGNPRFYSTFLDETLNKVIATIAVHSHPSQWEERTFQRLHLQATLLPGNHFAP